MGAVGYRLYAVRTVVGTGTVTPPAPPRKSPEEVRKAILSSLKDKVKLNDQQVAEIDKIYQDQHDSFDPIHTKYQAELDQIHAQYKAAADQLHVEAVAKIKSLLRPDQVPLYDQWQADRAAAAADRKRKQQEQQKRDGRPPGPRPQLP